MRRAGLGVSGFSPREATTAAAAAAAVVVHDGTVLILLDGWLWFV